MAIGFDPIPDSPLGGRVSGLDLSKPLADADRLALQKALPKYRALSIPGQQLAPEDFVRFGKIFGNPHPHVLEHLRLPGHPEILELTNIVEDDSKPNGHNGAAFWHTDNSYESLPASATMLYAREVPEQGGETLICDMVAAYQALPDAMKQRCASLVVRHRYGNRDQDKEFAAGKLQGDQADKVPEVTHALVHRHPVSGEACLYAVAASARGIVGIPDNEALELLNELKTHCTQPQFVVAHRYTVDEVFIWDTLATMHAAAVMDVASNASNTRRMYRISVKGHSGLPQ
ncbi:MAG: TauD/TfdA dioxygenase family protein [Burkholderiaceae bacterium]